MKTEEIKNALRTQGKPLAIAELEELTLVSRRTLQRVIRELLDAGEVEAEGQGRARRYRITSHTAQPSNAENARGAPASRRVPVPYDPEFLGSYRPNKDFYLPLETRERLHRLGQPASTLPAGTYARNILDRLLIDLSWNSSRLEGNTYSLLDTTELIERGTGAEGKSATETQMVLNHKAAIEFLVDGAREISFDTHTVCSLHALLSENLLADPADGGRTRSRPVLITGTPFVPLADPWQVQEQFALMMQCASRIEDPFEAGFFVLVHIPYLQPFADVNKRVSRLAANIGFIRGNLHPISFLDTDRDQYLRAVLGTYEFRNVRPLAAVFASAYERSAARYDVVRQTLGNADPFRLRYREAMKAAVSDVVRGAAGDVDVERILSKHLERIPPGDRDEFLDVARLEIGSLHDGNYARYRLRPSEFAAWMTRKEEP